MTWNNRVDAYERLFVNFLWVPVSLEQFTVSPLDWDAVAIATDEYLEDFLNSYYVCRESFTVTALVLEELYLLSEENEQSTKSQDVRQFCETRVCLFCRCIALKCSFFNHNLISYLVSVWMTWFLKRFQFFSTISWF